MKYYKDTQNNVYAYELDGSQDHLIGDKVAMTTEEVEAHLNPPKTAEQLLQEWKANRQIAVDNIEVTHNEVVYQGDEVSQGRMARAIVAMDDVMTIPWVAKDNSDNLLTKAELVSLLKMAGAIQSALWNEGRP